MNTEGREEELQAEVEEARARLEEMRREIHRVIVGQDALLDRLLIGLLCAGHVLLEGVPGLAKTLAMTTLAGVLDAEFKRIQFTPDLLPGDLLGSELYDPRSGDFAPRLGPVFANLLLADEVNRAPAKVQSALLEAMQERQVTIGGETFPLPKPFLVVATENPIEQEGTYPLPEAQLDRFLLKVEVPYPSREEEAEIVDRMAVSEPDYTVQPTLSLDEVIRCRRLADRIHADARIRDYVLDLVQATREPPEELALADLIQWGASPRASMYTVMAARARALLDGRSYVIPDDVKAVAPDILRHRIILTFEAEAEGVATADIIGRILRHIPVR